jgi:hypothetical protein
MIKYYIYHIPTYKRKNGKIGKIGCAKDHIQRVSEQGYSEYTILEIHDCIYEASKREIELQKQYGYPVDIIPYYKSIERRYNGCKKGGNISGKISIENGHMTKIQSLGGKVQGKIQGRKNVESGQWAIACKIGREKRKRPVLQYSISGDFIKEWDSAINVERDLKIDSSSIARCCKNKVKSAGKYVWKYKS